MDPQIRQFLIRFKHDWLNVGPRVKRTLFATILGCLPIVAAAHGITERIEPSLASAWFAIRGPREAPQSVSIVRLDKPAYDLVGLSTGEMFPRYQLAEVIDAIAAAGAKAIVIDLIFQRAWENAHGDELLASALSRSPSIIGRWTEKLLDVDESGNTSLRRLPVRPIPLFAQASTEIISLEIPDRDVSRHISMANARGFRTDAAVPLLAPLRRFISSDLVEPGGFDFINFYGGPSTLTSRSAAELLAPDKEINPAFYTDRVVFIGFIGDAGVGLMAGKDTFFTAYSRQPMYGVEIHATIAANLIDGSWIRRLPLQIEAVSMALATFVASFLILASGPILTPAIALTCACLWMGVSYLAFCQMYVFVPGITLCIAMTLIVIIRWAMLAAQYFKKLKGDSSDMDTQSSPSSFESTRM